MKLTKQIFSFVDQNKLLIFEKNEFKQEENKDYKS